MRVIGIDTASNAASVALVENGSLLSEKSDLTCDFTNDALRRGSKSNRAETLLPLIELLFESTGVSLQDITGFALSIGPGSFTGLRIGLSTVKGLAYGWQIPVVGVSTLLAYAARVTDYEGLICALLDARKNEVYTAVFRKTTDVVNRVTEDAVTSAANVVEMVRRLQRGSPCLFVGEGAVVYKHLFLELPGVCLPETTNYPTVAAAVARLGEECLRSNKVDDLGLLTPVYVRPSEAEFNASNMRSDLPIIGG
jgi:tRNA threonylcarbamoyladenosine biosynthesis protein TsaB